MIAFEPVDITETNGPRQITTPEEIVVRGKATAYCTPSSFAWYCVTPDKEDVLLCHTTADWMTKKPAYKLLVKASKTGQVIVAGYENGRLVAHE